MLIEVVFQHFWAVHNVKIRESTHFSSTNLIGNNIEVRMAPMPRMTCKFMECSVFSKGKYFMIPLSWSTKSSQNHGDKVEWWIPGFGVGEMGITVIWVQFWF